MEKLEFAKALGEKIIKSQHDYFAVAKIEDLDHITNLKRIIVAISEYLKSEIVSEEEVDDLVEHFRRFSKTLYQKFTNSLSTVKEVLFAKLKI